MRVSFFPTFSPIPVGGGVFDDGYSNRVILVWLTKPSYIEI
jgi:hypothetical protein